LNRQEAILQQLADMDQRMQDAKEKEDEPDMQRREEEARELQSAQVGSLADWENEHRGPTNVMHQ